MEDSVRSGRAGRSLAMAKENGCADRGYVI
jgi:hypothetical protein